MPTNFTIDPNVIYPPPPTIASDEEVSAGTSTTASPTVKQVNDNYVNVVSAQTIGGQKTFTGKVFLRAQTTAPTQAVSSNGTNVATTGYVNNKHQVVSALPATPDENVFYYIPEE